MQHWIQWRRKDMLRYMLATLRPLHVVSSSQSDSDTVGAVSPKQTYRHTATVPTYVYVYGAILYTSADIDECVTLSPCDPNASCTNTLGSFTCACNTGYTGDGMACYGRCLSLPVVSAFIACHFGLRGKLYSLHVLCQSCIFIKALVNCQWQYRISCYV